MKKLSKQIREYTLYGTNSFTYDELKNVALFCHAMCGSDTTSSFHKLGKIKIFQILSQDRNLREAAAKFNDPNAHRSSLYNVGIEIVKKLYASKNKISSMDL